MASDKKPSIYSDRSTIGSSDELDEYGVWVKSDPQNFSSGNTGSAADAASSLPDFDSGLDNESFDTELVDLDLPDLEVPDDDMVIAEETETFDSLESNTPGTPADTSLEDTSFDDFSIPEDDALINASINLEDSIGLDDSIELEDKAAPDDSISLDESIDLDESIGLDDGTNLENSTALEDIGFDDSISLDTSTKHDESIDHDERLDLDDGIELGESIDLDDGIKLDDGIGLDDGIKLDDGIELDDSIDLDDGSIELDDNIDLGDGIDLDENIDLDFPLAEEEPAEDAAFDSSGETPFEDAGFTEVAMDDFLDESPAELPAAGAVHTQSDLSTQLLMKIAEELSSIREELTSLKKEFAGIKAEASTDEKEKAESQHGGFFNEEEDEKIALTGDELDNILTTADFTEEAGEDATEELEGEFSFTEAEDDTSSGPFQVSDESVTDLESIADEDSIPDILSEQADIIGIDDHIDISAENNESVTDLESIADEDSIPDTLPEQGDISGIENQIDDHIDISAEGDDLILDQVDNFTPAFDNTDIKDAEYFEETDDSFDLQPEDTGGIETTVEDVGAIEDVGDLGDIGDLEDVGELEDISAFVAPADSEELQQLRENGAVHMTPAPEDTSYLDEGPLADSGEHDISLELPPEDNVPDAFDEDDSFEIQIEENAPEIQEEEASPPAGEEFPDGQAPDETSNETSNETSGESPDESPIGLSQAALDELELSSDTNKITVQEPSFDIPDDVPDDNLADADSETKEKEEVSVPDEGDSLDQVIPEGFVVVDDGETPVPFDDELEEVEALEDITDDIAPGEASNIPADSTDNKSAEYPDTGTNIPVGLKSELKIVLSYMDQLLESLPEEKIEEFAKSEYFDTYKKLFRELGLA